MSPESAFLKFSAEKLDQLCGRIETCVDKLSPDQIWARGNENENAIGNLMLHLAGNVRQWILHGVGGQPDHRQRDTEFDARGEIAADELKRRLRTTVDEAVALIRALPPERLSETRNIQKHYDVTVLQAIYHVVEHFSQHTGQVIFATKLLTGGDLGFYAYLRSAKAAGEETP
ncbi:MAG: DUF1572 domain-containing protein [Acidobacteriia bacterium]|nr:DUF1572 domain-containing protein [Terriglobia bacterium]